MYSVASFSPWVPTPRPSSASLARYLTWARILSPEIGGRPAAEDTAATAAQSHRTRIILFSLIAECRYTRSYGKNEARETEDLPRVRGGCRENVPDAGRGAMHEGGRRGRRNRLFR